VGLFFQYAVRRMALNGDAGRVSVFVSVQECKAAEKFPHPTRSSRSIFFRLVV
jgi:hypothetical protein